MNNKRTLAGLIFISLGILLATIQQPLPIGVTCITPILSNLGYTIFIVGFMCIVFSIGNKEKES